jgi:hypothetical protein
MEEFITTFEHLDFRSEGMSDDLFRECFISGLKDGIRAHVLMGRPQTVDVLVVAGGTFL